MAQALSFEVRTNTKGQAEDTYRVVNGPLSQADAARFAADMMSKFNPAYQDGKASYYAAHVNS